MLHVPGDFVLPAIVLESVLTSRVLRVEEFLTRPTRRISGMRER
jgi:hypothetical protein